MLINRPPKKGVRVCPSLIGAANWWSTAFDPATGLYYVSTLESCAIFSKRETPWEAGKVFNGGGTRESPEDPPKKYLRAIDIHTGRIAWELPQLGPVRREVEFSRLRAGCYSSAPMPTNSRPSTPRTGSCFGDSRRITSGGPRR